MPVDLRVLLCTFLLYWSSLYLNFLRGYMQKFNQVFIHRPLHPLTTFIPPVIPVWPTNLNSKHSFFSIPPFSSQRVQYWKYSSSQHWHQSWQPLHVFTWLQRNPSPENSLFLTSHWCETIFFFGSPVVTPIMCPTRESREQKGSKS